MPHPVSGMMNDELDSMDAADVVHLVHNHKWVRIHILLNNALVPDVRYRPGDELAMAQEAVARQQAAIREVLEIMRKDPHAPFSDRGDTVRIYILFAYDWHYPSGGSGDCLKVFTATTVAEAIEVAQAAIGDRHYDTIDLVRVTETELVSVEYDFDATPCN